MATARKTQLSESTEVKAKAAPRRKKASDETKKISVAAHKSTAKAKNLKTPVVAMETLPQDIEQLAYQLWEERGRPEGSGLEDWVRAEELLLS